MIVRYDNLIWGDKQLNFMKDMDKPCRIDLIGDVMIRSRIEELIENKGLKKKYVADLLGVSTAQLRNYETGHSLIPMDKAYILADLLKVKVDDLYERTEERNV